MTHITEITVTTKYGPGDKLIPTALGLKDHPTIMPVTIESVLISSNSMTLMYTFAGELPSRSTQWVERFFQPAPTEEEYWVNVFPDDVGEIQETEQDAIDCGEGATHRMHHHANTGNVTVWDLR